MKSAHASATILTIAVVTIILLGAAGYGTLAYSQGVPSAEVQGMPHSRIGQTQRGQAPMPMKEVAPETGAVPSAEVQGMPHSRVGQTQRGQAPMPMKEVASETGKVPPAEVQGMTSSRIGQTQRGQAPMPNQN